MGFFPLQEQPGNETFPHIQLIAFSSLIGSLSTPEKNDALRKHMKMLREVQTMLAYSVVAESPQ